MALSEMLHYSISSAKFRGTLITSSDVVFLSTCKLLASLWIATNYYAILRHLGLGIYGTEAQVQSGVSMDFF